MKTPRISRSALAAGAAAIGALGAIGVAQLSGGSVNPVMQFTQAQATDGTTSTTAAGGATEPGRVRKAPLDAETTEKVKAAALAAVPGATFEHAKKTDDGYAALLAKADGTRVLVREDADFKVTSVLDPAPARRHGHRHAPLDEATNAKVKAAAEGAVPGSTYRHGHKNHDNTGYKAIVTKADGTKVLVNLDNEFKVTSVQDPAPARPGRGDKAPLDEATNAKVKAAAEAAAPGATYRHGHANRDNTGYKALLTKADGTRVLVHMDSEFKVTKVEDPAPERGPGRRGHGRGDKGDVSPAGDPAGEGERASVES